MTGVQAFKYRGAMRYSLPGQVLILHPEEVHDGHCYDEAGFSEIADLDESTLQ